MINNVTFNFHLKFALCFKTCVGKLYSFIYLYVHLRLRNASKKLFIANAVKTILANYHLYTWQYGQLAQNTTTHYHNANGLFNDSSSESEND